MYLRLNKGADAKAKGEFFYDEKLRLAFAHGNLRSSEILFDLSGLDLAIDLAWKPASRKFGHVQLTLDITTGTVGHFMPYSTRPSSFAAGYRAQRSQRNPPMTSPDQAVGSRLNLRLLCAA